MFLFNKFNKFNIEALTNIPCTFELPCTHRDNPLCVFEMK